MHGELKIRDLSRAETALGDNFDLRELHVAVVGDGSLALVVLEEKIQRWIDAQR